MSNILVVMNDIPYPPSKNGVCSTFYNLIRCWVKQGNVIDIVYLNNREEKNEEILSNELGVSVEAIGCRGREIFMRLFEKIILKPRNCWQIKSEEFPLINCAKYDYVIMGSLSAATVIKGIRGLTGKLLFFEADSGLMYYTREYEQTSNLLRKCYLFSQKICIARLEKILYQKVDKVIFVSDVDREFADKRFKGNFCINKIAVDVPLKYKKTIGIDNKNNILEIGFSGIMDYDPNTKAVDYIINKIIPELEKETIDYRIHLIGKNPLERWKDCDAYKQGKLVITGFVNSVEEYLAKMDIYISPLFLGSGMKNKILQAMGVGVPIICSSVSAEGISELINGENCYIVSDNPSQWSEKIMQLANSYQERKMFSDITKKIIEHDYSWDEASRKLLGDNND